MAKLTPKQARFAEEYLIDLNGTQAAIRAGYSPKTAYSMGNKNLKNPAIKALIEKNRARLQQQTEITQARVLNELAAIAFADSTDFTANGVPVVAKALHKTASKLKALEMLGKHLGLFIDRVEIKEMESSWFKDG